MCSIYLVCFVIIFPLKIFGDTTVTADEYYQMPDLFYMDDYPKCMSRAENIYCQGIFEISSAKPSRVYDVVRIISNNAKRNFNHTRIHRSICLGTTHASCPLDATKSWKENFKNCVQNMTKKSHDFNSNLIEFHMCKNSAYKRPWDFYDKMFLSYIILVIWLNIIGTYYDCFLKKYGKGNPWLLCFSLRANWKRYSCDGVPENDKECLNCFTAMRGVLVPFVLMAHVPLAMITYTINPRDVEELIESPSMMFLARGTVLVQIFFISSSFIQTYQMLKNNESRRITFKNLLLQIIGRYIRLSPMLLTAVGFASTLSPHTNDGPLWSIVEKEADLCRGSFWIQFFLTQHWYFPECIGQSWYLAVSFQIYIICTLLLYYLLKTKTNVIRTLVNIFILNQIIVYAVVYIYDLKPTANPELFLNVFRTDESFLLLYQSLWGNLPAGLLGILAAYIYYEMGKNKIDLKESKHLFAAVRLSVPLVLLNLLGGYWLLSKMSSKWMVSLFITLDKPIFSIKMILLIYGCLFEVNPNYKRVTEWPGWKYLSRLSLGSLLFHTVHTKYQTASLLGLQTFSKVTAVSNWFANMGITVLMALPLTVMIELPFIALWKTIRSSSNRTQHTKEVKQINGKINGDHSS